MKTKRLILSILIPVIVAGCVFGGYKIGTSRNANAEAALVQSSFLQSNPGVTIIGQAAQTKMYIVEWRDGNTNNLSALIGGVWVKVASVPLAIPESQEGG